MVLLSSKFHMKSVFFFIPIVNNGVLYTCYFYILPLVVVFVFTFLHSIIACHKLFGINAEERKSIKSHMTTIRLYYICAILQH